MSGSIILLLLGLLQVSDDLLELFADLRIVTPCGRDCVSAHGAFAGCLEMLVKAWFKAKVCAAAWKHARLLQSILPLRTIQNDTQYRYVAGVAPGIFRI